MRSTGETFRCVDATRERVTTTRAGFALAPRQRFKRPLRLDGSLLPASTPAITTHCGESATFLLLAGRTLRKRPRSVFVTRF